MERFRGQFKFDREKALYIGVERECFLLDHNGRIAPLAPRVLTTLTDFRRFGYELSACQLEERAGPSRNIDDLRTELERNDSILTETECELGFRRLHIEVAPEDMPLDVYPDPTGRYQRITRGMTRDTLLAACRVAGTHVHIGMPDHETALHAYNRVISHCPALCEKGNGSFGDRLAIYRVMAPDYAPEPYRNWDAFHETALQKGFVEDPRRCWTLIRISVHGTLEFRMFGATPSLSRIVEWARACRSLCERAVR